jgi:putative addiction module killer protein
MRGFQTIDFVRWLNSLRDIRGRTRILVRVDRLLHGTPGDMRHVEAGVCELRIDFGPGYRVYYMVKGSELVIFLCGGDKSTQRRDIAKALKLRRGFLDA